MKKLGIFDIDSRSARLFSLGLGTVIILDTIGRLLDFQQLFSTQGFYPFELMLLERGESNSWSYKWSLAYISESDIFQIFLLLTYGCSALPLLNGRASFPFRLLTWILVCSIHARNPSTHNAGDTLLRLYLFWSLFIPLQKANGFHTSLTHTKILSYPSNCGLMLQIAFVYLFSSLIKGDPVWRESAEALSLTLQLESFQLPGAKFLFEQKSLLPVLSKATLIIQEVCPFLIFSPIFRYQLRIIIPLVMIGFHLLAVGLTLAIGLFPLISALGWIIFLPPQFWNFLPQKFHSSDGQPFVYLAPSKKFKLASFLPAVLLIYIVTINLPSVSRKYFSTYASQTWLRPASILYLRQSWRLFAPHPQTKDGWYVSVASTESGRSINLITYDVPPNWEKPRNLRIHYGSMRKRKYLLSMFHRRNYRRLSYYSQYLVSSFNDNHPEDKIRSHELFFVSYDTLLPKRGFTHERVFPIPDKDSNEEK